MSGLYTTPEVSQLTGIHESTLQNYASTGQIPIGKSGQAWAWSEKAIDMARNLYAHNTAPDIRRTTTAATASPKFDFALSENSRKARGPRKLAAWRKLQRAAGVKGKGPGRPDPARAIVIPARCTHIDEAAKAVKGQRR